MYYFVLILDKFKGFITEKKSSLSSEDEGKALYHLWQVLYQMMSCEGGEVIVAEFQILSLWVIHVDSPTRPATGATAHVPTGVLLAT